MNAEIIILTEKGHLESTSKLLIYSLRNFGGAHSKLPIYSYKPRKGNPLSRSTLKFFEQNEVEYIDLPLNQKYTDDPFANKPIACTHREQNTKADYLFYLDSDMFFLNPPDEFDAIKDVDALLRPVHFRFIGSEAGFSGKNGAYWKKLYELLGVKKPREVVSTIDKKRILEYFNGGMLITKTRTGLFSQWLDNFEKVMNAGLVPLEEKFFLEQSIFSATVSQLELKVKLLSEYYNCPASRFTINPSIPNRIEDVHNVILVHHHNIFRNRDASNPVYNELNYFPNGKIINQKLVEFGVQTRDVKGFKLLKRNTKTAVKKVLKRVLKA